MSPTIIQPYPRVVGGDQQLGGVGRQELHARYLLPRLLPTPLVLHICNDTPEQLKKNLKNAVMLPLCTCQFTALTTLLLMTEYSRPHDGMIMLSMA